MNPFHFGIYPLLIHHYSFFYLELIRYMVPRMKRFIPAKGILNDVSNTNPTESIPIGMTDGCRSRQILRAEVLRRVFWYWIARGTVMVPYV